MQHITLNFLDQNPSKKELLKKYAHIIYEHNKVMNLVGYKSEEEILEHGIVASILAFENFLKQSQKSLESQKLVDIGAGAGFPGVALLLFYNNFELTIIESLQKRCKFLELIKKELKIDFKIINKRAEECLENKDSFDYVTARAVADVKTLFLISNHLLKINGNFILLKGKNYQDELNDFFSTFKNQKENTKIFTYKTINNENSFIIEITKKSKTPNNWPLRWKQIKNYK